MCSCNYDGKFLESALELLSKSAMVSLGHPDSAALFAALSMALFAAQHYTYATEKQGRDPLKL